MDARANDFYSVEFIWHSVLLNSNARCKSHVKRDDSFFRFFFPTNLIVMLFCVEKLAYIFDV